MKSNYKTIGTYVQQANERNKALSVTELKGININKEFMPSVANITGTDLSKYKVVNKGQFAFNPMHVGRDEVLPIGLLQADEPIIVSPAYVVFEVIDKELLDPEYLMMWCQRSEFDRNAWFTTDNSVRGGFSWSDFCEMELPVPHIDKQREIVREYNTIVERIKLNERINQSLNETAQALYKRWFVDFEFPISKEYAKSIGMPELEGKPYHSSGGKFTYCGYIDMEVPSGWREVELKEFGKAITGKTPSSSTPEHFGEKMPFVTPTDYKHYFKHADTALRGLSIQGIKGLQNKVVPKGSLLVTCIGSDMGRVIINDVDCITNQQINTLVLKNNKYLEYLFYWFRSKFDYLRSIAIGSSTMLMINKTEFEEIFSLFPPEPIVDEFNLRISCISEYMKPKEKEIVQLSKLKTMLLKGLSAKGGMLQ